MRANIGFIIGICCLFVGCSSNHKEAQKEAKINETLQANGHWIIEKDGQVMLNPQTSALVKWRGGLLTLSDRSADPSQRLRLRSIAHESASLNGPDLPMVLSKGLENSCFGPYVSDNPDLEALVVDPNDDRIFYMVTEDGSYAEPMSAACQQKYVSSGSTVYPTLLVRLELQENKTVLITHIRPIQFTLDMYIGDFPNDGIEALAFGKNRTLYLGLEKDSNKHARILSLQIDSKFWQSDEFAQVSEPSLKLPKFENGNHPINGMDYYQTKDGGEFLLAAARNDQDLWVIDLSGKKDTKILPIDFYAEIQTPSKGCKNYEAMHNSSIEGVAVVNETLWLVNDPWKAMYLKNIKCAQNSEHYEKFAPLLFALPIQQEWFN